MNARQKMAMVRRVERVCAMIESTQHQLPRNAETFEVHDYLQKAKDEALRALSAAEGS